MTRLSILAFTLLLAPLSWAHDNSGCEALLQTEAMETQRRIWRLEQLGNVKTAGYLRARLEAALKTVPITSLTPVSKLAMGSAMYNSDSSRAFLKGGAQGIFKPLGGHKDIHTPKSEIAAVITNEELGFPVRIPVTVWRENPEPGSLQLWVEGHFLYEDVVNGDLQMFDFVIDNFDRINSNRLMTGEFGSIAIDHAGAFGELIPFVEWTNTSNYKYNCVHPAFTVKLPCVLRLLDEWNARAQAGQSDWTKRIQNLNVPRLLQRLEPWVEPEMLKRLIVRLCILREYYASKDYVRCEPYVKDAGILK